MSSALSCSRARTPGVVPAVGLRLVAIEGWLAQGETPTRVMRRLQDEGLRKRQAQKYIRLVYSRWEAESRGMGREMRRAQMREMMLVAYAESRAKVRVLLDKDGGEHTYADPDMRTAAGILETLCRFDGLLAQPGGTVVNIIGDKAIEALSDFFAGPRVIDAEGETVP